MGHGPVGGGPPARPVRGGGRVGRGAPVNRGSVRPNGLTLKELPDDERPRERMARHGPGALADAELLAILLGTGTPRETAVGLARRLLGADPDAGLRALVDLGLEELAAVRGIGLAKAARLKAAVELGRRLAADVRRRPQVKSPADAAALLMEDMRYLDQEQFRIALLNVKNQVMAVETVSVGGLSSSPVHPREIFKRAIKRSAAAIILAHNHPSGDPTPSREDIEVTRRLKDAGTLLGIEVLDHIVIGDNRYVSFRERGLA